MSNAESDVSSLRNENLVSLVSAAKYFEVDGKKPHASSLWRWCRIGLAGGKVKLRYRRYGRRIVTSFAACEQFSRELAEADLDTAVGVSVATQQPRQRRALEIARAEHELKEAGI